MKRLRLHITGAVQGVGFRPFVYRLAGELQLAGWIKNSPQGVVIEIEGDEKQLEDFSLRLNREKPLPSAIYSLEKTVLDPAGYFGFEIRESAISGKKTALVLPDIATCSDCLREIFDPLNRRYLYPFTNCTNCGPRFTIIEALPYDRPNTTMKHFEMCEQCRAEYENPRDRRFHAQPNACSVCGPALELWDAVGAGIAAHQHALSAAVDALRKGGIVAVKGLGGFHLMADAGNADVVQKLRRRKHREEKPFAVMFPSMESVRQLCTVSGLEESLLASPQAPIVLLQKRTTPAENSPFEVCPAVAPGNPCLGAMLPYTPLHHILMRQVNAPLVATSGNISDEPICTDEYEALDRLQGIADFFLVHNRPIVRHVDDSIVRIISGREMALRRARGYAPLPVMLPKPIPSTLGVGAHLKNTVALSIQNQVFISQHIGDLETEAAYVAFQQVNKSLSQLYSSETDHSKTNGMEAAKTGLLKIACDVHPDYVSTQFAAKSGRPPIKVQHHYAHILSCMAENGLQPPVLGICWDGSGYGLDNTVWGGEFLSITTDYFERLGHFRTFPLPGGEAAVKEPRRSALGMLYAIWGDTLFTQNDLPLQDFFSLQERTVLRVMLAKKTNTPLTSSVGRMFDAVASLLKLCQFNRFEGQAAMMLEFQANPLKTADSYNFKILPGNKNGQFPQFRVNWQPMLESVLEEVKLHVAAGVISTKFHNTFAEIAAAAAKIAGVEKVALSGGCFQNRYLAERTIRRLKEEGFHPYWHQRVPPNDGGISLGQVVAANHTALFRREHLPQSRKECKPCV